MAPAQETHAGVFSPREDDDGFSKKGNVVSAVMGQRCKLLKAALPSTSVGGNLSLT